MPDIDGYEESGADPVNLKIGSQDAMNIWMCGEARGDSVLDVGCSQGIATVLLSLASSGDHLGAQRDLDINESARKA